VSHSKSLISSDVCTAYCRLRTLNEMQQLK
jgi:hypothetical protein